MNSNDELYHYGVKGMRWGQRKAVLKTEYKARAAKAYGDRDKLKKAKNDYKTKLAKEKESYNNSPEGLRRRYRAGMTAVSLAIAGIGAMSTKHILDDMARRNALVNLLSE